VNFDSVTDQLAGRIIDRGGSLLDVPQMIAASRRRLADGLKP
jgi:hypothetical protein